MSEKEKINSTSSSEAKENVNAKKILVNEKVDKLCDKVSKIGTETGKLSGQVQFYINMISGVVQTDMDDGKKEDFIVELVKELEGEIKKYEDKVKE